MTELWGGGVPTSIRDYYRLILYWYSYVLFFTSPILPPSSGTSPTLIPTVPSAPASAPHHTTPNPTAPHCLPSHPGSSVHLDVAWVPLYVVSSTWILGVSYGVPFIYHGHISLSPPLSLPRSPGQPRSTHDSRASNWPSLPPHRRTSLH